MVLRLKQTNSKSADVFDDDAKHSAFNDSPTPSSSSTSSNVHLPGIGGSSGHRQVIIHPKNAERVNNPMGSTFSVYKAFHRFMKLFRRAVTGVRFDVEPEVYDLPSPRYKPETIEKLCRSTKFTRRELQQIYRSFKQACPSGLASESLLQDMYSQFFPNGDASLYAHFVFKTFDQDGNGSLNFEEFVVGLSSLSRGTIDEKLQWAFSLYDINGDGRITREELNEIVTSIYSLMGHDACLLMDNQTPQEHVDRVFKRMDLNEDGVVTKEEFMEICYNDESIRRSITALDTVL
ncbi:KCNIP4 (predicted) [Pycnogonum litorale]